MYIIYEIKQKKRCFKKEIFDTFLPPPAHPTALQMLEVSDHWPLANSRDGRRQGAENALMAGPLLESDTEHQDDDGSRSRRTGRWHNTGGGGGATRKQASSTWQHNLPPSHSGFCRIVPPAPCVPVRGMRRGALHHDASNTT
jgi:hypothetical protein